MSEIIKNKIVPDFLENDQLVTFIESNIARESEIKRIKLQNSMLKEKLKQATEELQTHSNDIQNVLQLKKDLQSQKDQEAQHLKAIDDLHKANLDAHKKLNNWEAGFDEIATSAMQNEEKLRSLIAEVARLKNNATQFNQKMNEQIAETNLMKQNFKENVQSRDQLIISLRQKLKSLIEIAQNERNQLKPLKESLTKAISENQAFASTIKQLNLKINEVAEIKSRELKAQYQKELTVKVSEMDLQLVEKEKALRVLLENKVKAHASEIRSLQDKNKALELETAEEHERKLKSVRTANTLLTLEVCSLRDSVDLLSKKAFEENAAFDQKIKKADLSLQAAETAAREQEAKTRMLEEELSKKEEQLSELAVRIKEGQLNNIRLQQMEFETANYRQQKADLDTTIKEREAQLQQKEERIKKQETYLSRFRATLNEAKEGLAKSASHLMRELSTAQHLSPLNELISFTNFEIERVASALRRTPSVAPERNTLEQTLKQLEDQKAFLQSAIKKSEHEIFRQVQEVEALLISGAFLKSPPSPLELDS